MKKKNRMFLLVLISFFLFAGCEAENEVVAEKSEITAKKSEAVAEKPSIVVGRLWTKQEIIDMEKRANSMGGLLSYAVTTSVRPTFYQGQMPLEYVSIGKRMGVGGGMMSGFSSVVICQNFGEWRNMFFYDEKTILYGMPDGAIAIDNSSNTLVAECKVTRQITGEGQLFGFELEENHYDLQGYATFNSTFEVDFHKGVKTKEIKTYGVKEKEYFFIWPTGFSAGM